MRKLTVFLCAMLLVFVGTAFAETVIFDDFNDGNADGWLSGRSCNAPSWCGLGNWRVEDGQVTQDLGGDHYVFLIDNYPMTDQSVEAKVLWHDNGYGGLVIWRQDEDNWVYIAYPWRGNITVGEKWCNSSPPCGRDDNFSFVAYPHEFTERKWQTLKVVANSLTGEIAVYLDGEYLLTHTVGANISRNGLSGFISSNAGATFDDFRLTSDDINPEPCTVDIHPDTLNKKSKGKYITSYIELPETYSVEDIDIETVILSVNEDSIQAESSPTEIGDYNDNGIPDFMVKFDRQLVQDACGTGAVEMTLTCQNYDGVSFEGTDIVLAIEKGQEHYSEDQGSVIY